MDFNLSSSLLFFLSLFGSFNGIFVSLYFLFGKPSSFTSNKFLGLLILMITIRVSKSVFLYFVQDIPSIIIHIGLAACAAIGPLTYLFVKSSLKEENFRIKKLYHLILMVVVIVVGEFFIGYKKNPKIWVYFINLIYLQWFVYLIFSSVIFFRVKNIQDSISNYKLVTGAFFGSCLIWLVYILAGFLSYISGAVTYSFVIYFLLWSLIERYIEFKKIRKDEIPKEIKHIVLKGLKTKFEDQKLFKNPDLNLPKLADEIGVTHHQLSEIINTELNKNVSQYINEHRIKESKNLLRSDSKDTIEKIAYDSGFSSPSNFYSNFKKKEGCTPVQYRKKSN